MKFSISMFDIGKDEIRMKKFLKFLFCTFSLITSILGVYYIVKNVINKNDTDDDFDDFEDDFDEDFDLDSDEESSSDSREYVPINLNGSQESETEESLAHYEAEESVSEEE